MVGRQAGKAELQRIRTGGSGPGGSPPFPLVGDSWDETPQLQALVRSGGRRMPLWGCGSAARGLALEM